MTTKLAAVCGLAAALAAAPALATEGNPVSGIGVSVESSPGGIKMASTDCAEGVGKLSVHADGKTYCDVTPAFAACAKTPGDIYACRKGRGLAVGRGGGSFAPVQPGPARPAAPAQVRPASAPTPSGG